MSNVITATFGKKDSTPIEVKQEVNLNNSKSIQRFIVPAFMEYIINKGGLPHIIINVPKVPETYRFNVPTKSITKSHNICLNIDPTH